MEFLVAVQTSLPADMDPDRRAELLNAEARYATALIEAGVIVRIWRVPGRTASVGIWSSPDATELHVHLSALPLFSWLDIDVTPLARHPLQPAVRASPQIPARQNEKTNP
jgi:muconolactone D-isomerase